MLGYLAKVAIALSVLVNVVLGGESNQTFSARNWARKRENKLHLVPLIDLLFWWDKNHCSHAWSYWAIRKNLQE